MDHKTSFTKYILRGEARPSSRGSALTRSISKSILSRSVAEKKGDELEYKHPAVATIAEEEDAGPRTILDDAAFSKKLNTGRRYTDILRRIGGYYENVLSSTKEQQNAEELEFRVRYFY